MGDPCGIGPEICLRLLAEHVVSDVCIPLIFGDAKVLTTVGNRLKLDLPAAIHELGDREWQSTEQPAIVNVSDLHPDSITPGKVSAIAGQSSFDYLLAAINAAKSGEVAAICTAPINKEALNAAGIAHPGHTEILAEETGTDDYCMLMTSEAISCALVTTHIGLGEVATELTTESILSAIRLSADALRRIRGREPKVVVCGLNPHAGEHGLFGNMEEEKIIQPAIDAARSAGVNISGPMPPDTAFLPSERKLTDVYVCMYHDQGLIPLKALAFDTAVNVTLGLPVIRTSVDHGTAFDIAWQGVAGISSLESAMRLAAKLTVGAK